MKRLIACPVRLGFGAGMIIGVADQRRNRTTDQPDAMRVSSRRDLAIRSGDGGNHRAMRRGIHGSVAGQCAEIVDAFQNDRRAHVGPVDHVPIEAREQIGAGAVEQHPIAADPGVDHRQAPPWRGSRTGGARIRRASACSHRHARRGHR